MIRIWFWYIFSCISDWDIKTSRFTVVDWIRKKWLPVQGLDVPIYQWNYSEGTIAFLRFCMFIHRLIITLMEKWVRVGKRCKGEFFFGRWRPWRARACFTVLVKWLRLLWCIMLCFVSFLFSLWSRKCIDLRENSRREAEELYEGNRVFLLATGEAYHVSIDWLIDRWVAWSLD